MLDRNVQDRLISRLYRTVYTIHGHKLECRSHVHVLRLVLKQDQRSVCYSRQIKSQTHVASAPNHGYDLHCQIYDHEIISTDYIVAHKTP